MERKKEAGIRTFGDRRLQRDPGARRHFRGILASAGLLRACPAARSKVSAFFVLKKSGALRIVWDCRVSNLAFREAPPVDLGSADSLQRLEVDASQELYVAHYILF